MPRRALACAAIVGSLAWSLPARAGNDGAPGRAPAAEASQADALPVTIKLVSTPIQAEAVRTAIETELKVPVRLHDEKMDEGLAVGVKWRRATVSYRSKRGETTARSLDLPANVGQAVEVIALLAGNLARDEASELLARLAPPPSAATEGATAAGATSPPAEQAPPSKPAEPAKPTEKEKPPPAKPAPKKPLEGLVPGSPAALNLSFFYPVTLLEHSERRVMNLELGFAYSRVGAVEGVGFTVGYLRVLKGARGVVGSFGFTRVDGDIKGVQWGGLFTEGHGTLRGAEIGEFGALRWGNIEGVQAGAFVSLAKDVKGLQSSVGVSIASDVEGVQGGVVNVARDLQGAQVDLVGVARDIDGAQVGLVNVSKSADVQIGLVNVAERIDGAAIGLVSIAGNGTIEPTAYAIGGSRVSYNAGVKFVAGLFYSQLAVGTNSTESNARSISEVGGGLHVEPPLFRNGTVLDRMAIEVGGHVAHSYLPRRERDTVEEDSLHYRAGVGLRFVRTLWLLGGYDVSHDLSPFAKNVGQGPWAGVAVF